MIIQNLKKKALILHVNNVVTIFCNSFLDFISRDDIKITEQIQQIEKPIEAHLVPIDKDLEDRYESAIDKEIKENPILKKRLLKALNQITGKTMIGEGRVYGGGMYKIEPKELANVPSSEIYHVLKEYTDWYR